MVWSNLTKKAHLPALHIFAPQVDETADLRQLAAVDGSGLFWAAKHPKMPGKAPFHLTG